MSTPQQSEGRTRTFARVLGPYLAFATIVALIRASQMPTLMSEFRANTVWAWVTGVFVLLAGLIVIALHPYWRGVPAIIVSILGVLTTLKGALLLAIPQSYLSAGESMLDGGGWWKAVFAVMAVVGLYLTYVGWAPTRTPSTTQADSSAPDLSAAA